MTIQEMIDAVNYRPEDFSFCCNLVELIDYDNAEEIISFIQKRFNCSQEIANNFLIEFKKQIYSEFKKIEAKSRTSLTPQQIAHNNAVARELLNKPKCPTCSSTNVQKIGPGERLASITLFGIFSDKINKTFKCNNCGYTW